MDLVTAADNFMREAIPLVEDEDCDHSVGICFCSFREAYTDLKRAVAHAKNEAVYCDTCDNPFIAGELHKGKCQDCLTDVYHLEVEQDLHGTRRWVYNSDTYKLRCKTCSYETKHYLSMLSHVQLHEKLNA